MVSFYFTYKFKIQKSCEKAEVALITYNVFVILCFMTIITIPFLLYIYPQKNLLELAWQLSWYQ
jgi:hypothetical protein